MRILFVDTETNGLPVNRHLSEKQWAYFPEILQLGWEVWDLTVGVQPTLVKSEDYLLKQSPHIKWSAEAEKFHKIPLDLCQNTGLEWIPVLSLLNSDIQSCDAIVAHNLEFDRKIIRAAMYRTEIVPWPENTVGELCTMRGTEGFFDFGLNRIGKPKAPSLKELHNVCIPGTYDCSGAGGPWHNAAHDLHCTALCFWVLCRDQRAQQILKKCNQLTGCSLTATQLTTMQGILPYTGV